MFDGWHQTGWIEKQCQYELIEVQRAELAMSLDKPKKDMFIGL